MRRGARLVTHLFSIFIYFSLGELKTCAYRGRRLWGGGPGWSPTSSTPCRTSTTGTRRSHSFSKLCYRFPDSASIFLRFNSIKCRKFVNNFQNWRINYQTLLRHLEFIQDNAQTLWNTEKNSSNSGKVRKKLFAFPFAYIERWMQTIINSYAFKLRTVEADSHQISIHRASAFQPLSLTASEPHSFWASQPLPKALKPCMMLQFMLLCVHWRRIKTEEKAKVVAAVWGADSIHFFATLAIFSILHQDDMKNRINCTRTIWRIGLIAPGQCEE